MERDLENAMRHTEVDGTASCDVFQPNLAKGIEPAPDHMIDFIECVKSVARLPETVQAVVGVIPSAATDPHA